MRKIQPGHLKNVLNMREQVDWLQNQQQLVVKYNLQGYIHLHSHLGVRPINKKLESIKKFVAVSLLKKFKIQWPLPLATVSSIKV